MPEVERDVDGFLYRVWVSDEQAVVGVERFGAVGVGFADEDVIAERDLPANLPAPLITDWIMPNAGDKSITRDAVVAAVEALRAAVLEDHPAEPATIDEQVDAVIEAGKR